MYAHIYVLRLLLETYEIPGQARDGKVVGQKPGDGKVCGKT